MKNPFQIVRDFEEAVCEYTGAPYCVTTTSCSMALLLAVAFCLRKVNPWLRTCEHQVAKTLPEDFPPFDMRYKVEIPNRTYVSVPMSIIHAGGRPTFRDEDWKGSYQLKPLPVWDSARWFTSGLYSGAQRLSPGGTMILENHFEGKMVCVSFHWSKTLGIQQGGAILHDNPEADAWLRRARFDGRTEGVDPLDDTFTQVGWHAYLSPEVAAEGLVRMRWLPKHNEPLPNDAYPDLSKLEIFR